MKNPFFLSYLLFFPILAIAQIEPNKVLPSDEFYKAALKDEADRKAHTLDLKALLEKLKSQKPKVLIDLRSQHSFKYKHLKDAVNIPMEDLTEEKLSKLIPDKKTEIIVYCDNSFTPTRMIALTTYGYPTLKKFGYENVFDIEPLWRKTMHSPNELEPYWEKTNE